MEKPYNTEIVKIMANHSDEAAAYASAMKWDFYRRQKVEDIEEDILGADCAFCVRYDYTGQYGGRGKCALYKAIGGCCHVTTESLYLKALTAKNDKDQQAFTTAANDLYFLICKIIEDMYKPKKKEEVFYSVGQKFSDAGGGLYRLSLVGHCKVNLLTEDGQGCYKASPYVVSDVRKITKLEFGYVCGVGTFTLIDESKK